jgi:4-alpha-glucanotransferase
VREYAHKHGIFLKGDIPIGVNREGVDVEVEPEYFNMNFQAGAPPDAFSATGQIWGFPTYNWQAMEADGFNWWKKRFRKMADYFDAYRIDHILGFFRIWQVPINAKSGLEGYFNPALPYSRKDIEWSGLPLHTLPVLFIEDDVKKEHYHPKISVWDMPEFQQLYEHDKQIFYGLYNEYFYHRHNEFWKSEALKHLLPLVNATDMLVCGEDLGMIPQTVPEVMNQLQILSLEIERMPKTPEQTFTPLYNLPYRSVCTTGTHDMSVLRAWWKEDRAQTQRYYNEILWKYGAAPDDCTPELVEQIIVNHLHSPAMLVIVPWQDWLAIDGDLRNPDAESERINVPANSRHYWRYRMHIPVEKLSKLEELNARIKNLILLNRK